MAVKKDMQFEHDVKELLSKLKKMSEGLDSEEKKKILSYAAEPLVQKAASLAPQSDRPHYRYDTPKLAKGIRAPKGLGKRVATYLPGNLKMSIQVLKHGVFKRLKSVVFVGVKVSRRGSGKGTFGMRRFDAYYSHWVEFGTKFMRARPFMRPAFQSTKLEIERRIVAGCKSYFQKFARENKVT